MMVKKMARIDRQEIIRITNAINKKEGSGTVYTIDSPSVIQKVPRWSTGLADLDNILGGGMPEGRTIEIYGPEGSGKTTLLYHLYARHELALHVPIEGCVDKDTEFFNGKGWKKISEYVDGDMVLQYNADGSTSLVKPLKYHCLNAPLLWHVFSQRLDMVVSENHNVVYKPQGSNNLKIKPFCEIREALDWNKGGFAGNIPKTFEYSGAGINLDEWTVRLMVAIFADGNFSCNSTNCYVGLKKSRKIKRMKMLLKKCGIKYRIKNGFFIFYAPAKCKHYPKSWYNMTKEQFAIVIDEMKNWDGCQFEKGHVPSFTTTYKEDADFIQFAYTVLGYAAYITTRDRRQERKFIGDREIKTEKVSYAVCSGLYSSIVSLRKAKYNLFIPEDGKMYCFTMPSGMWVMRRNDKIIVTGNTFESARAKVFGNHPKQLLVYRARFGEDAFNKTLTYSKSGMPIIGIDSIPSLVPKEDVEKMFKAADKDTIEDQRIGGVARLMEKYLPAIEPVIEVSGTTLIFINQVRDNMQAMLFGDKTRTPGGHRAKHSYSIRIQVARKEWIEIPNKDPHNTEAKEKVGFIMKCKTVKNKTADPMKSCELPCFFDRGFVSFDDIDAIRKELMKERAKRYK